MRRTLIRLALCLVAPATLAMPGCDFFNELESEDSAETGDSEGDEVELPDGECAFPRDDRCANQDVVVWCDPETKEAQAIDCGDECGGYENFSCVNTGAGHGCWCVEPGLQKVYSCTELEDCLAGCVSDPTGACADACFTRTTSSTIRLYGALVHCSNDQCHDTCVDTPELCSSCIDAGLREGAGECGLERSVCDQDVNDENPWG